MPAAEFNRWFDKRLGRKRRAMNRLERLKRRRGWHCAALGFFGTLFVLWALAGYASELWGAFGR